VITFRLRKLLAADFFVCYTASTVTYYNDAHKLTS